MKKNNYLVIILFIFTIIIGLVCIDTSINYRDNSSKSSVIYNSLLNAGNTIGTVNTNDNNTDNIENEDTTATPETGDEEINLGDDGTCAGYTEGCLVGQMVDGKCQIQVGYRELEFYCSGEAYSACSNSWVGGCCRRSRWVTKYRWTTAGAVSRKVCNKCIKGYFLRGEACIKCQATVKSSRSMISVSDSPTDRQWCAIVEFNNGQESCGGMKVNYSPAKCITPKAACGKSQIIVSGDISKVLTVPVSGAWKKAESAENGKVYVDTEPTASTEREADSWIFSERANENPVMAYGKNCQATDEPGKYVCDEYYTRGSCGSQPIKTYSYCCVDNQFIGTSTEKANSTDKKGGVKWADHVLVNYNQKKNGKSGCEYYFGSGYTVATNPDGSLVPKNKCSPPEIINRCDLTQKSMKVLDPSPETDKCEDEVTLTFNEGEGCSKNTNKIENSFYTINCTRTVKANFDYDDDGNNSTVRELYKGQGFKFGINVKTMFECEKTFNGTLWGKTYKNILGRLETIDTKLAQYYQEYNVTKWQNRYKQLSDNGYFKGNVKKDVYKLWVILDELRDVVSTYNAYEPNDDYNEAASLSFSYKVNGKKVQINPTPQFVRTVVNKGTKTYTYKKTANLGVNNKKLIPVTPISVKWNTKSNPRVVKLNFKEVYINSENGSLQNSAANGYSGGNRVYLDYDTDAPQTILPISIELTGFIGNASKIINNKCTIKVKDLEILYRPIDVSNPFINNEWTPGSNWINNNFDFRNIIDAKIWSQANCYSMYTNNKWSKCSNS